MTAAVDSAGRPLPEIERPSEDRLRVYGDLMFLAFRSPRHAGMTTGLLRTYFEPPILLGQFRIFRFDGVPRGMFTWGHLDEAAERKLVSGAPLAPEDWNSGQRLWLIDLIAPYRGLAGGMVRWIMEPGNFTDRDFHFRRLNDRNETRRIVHIDFHRDRLSRVMSDRDFLTEA